MWANKGFSVFALKMRVVGFCLCLLGYISFTASMQSETENDWQNNFLSDGTYEVEPSQEMMKAGSKYKLPFYIPGDSASAVAKQKKWFHYNNRGPLPAEAKAVMLPVTAKTPVTAKPLKPMVETLCHLDRMYVRIRKDAIKGKLTWKYLYFGNCRVNAARGAHYYFLYNITRCGLRPQVLDDVIVFTNVVRYLRKYTTLKNITRKPTFTVPVACRFPRFHRTYDFGMHPVLGFNATMPLPVSGGPTVTIVVLDANWKPLAPGAFYQLGQTMHFEIRGSGGQRVFANRCWFSATSKLHTTLTYTAIKNYGCLADSMNSTRSRYQRTTDPSVMRLIIETFVFANVATEQVLTLHCSISVAKTAALHRKACTYVKSADMWHELDRRVDLLCLCCKGVCPAPPSPRHRTETVSSMPWKIQDGMESDKLDLKAEKDEEMETEEVQAEDVDEETYADPELVEETYADPELGEETYSDPELGVETYSDPELGVETYSDPELGEETYSDPELGEETYSDPELGEETYADPVLREETYADPVLSEGTYADPGLSEETYGDTELSEETDADPELEMPEDWLT